MADDLNQLMKPAGAGGPSGDEPVIHVIPEKFYGAALKKNVPKSAPAVEAANVPATDLQVPPPTQAGESPIPPVKRKKSKLPIILIVLLLLILAGLGAYFFLFSKPAAPVNTNTVANTNVPSGPVCGNTRCEAPTENSTLCPTDCPPPAPTCGDLKCDASESNASCPGDCAPPAPVCGNDICEEPSEAIASCPEDCRPPAPTPGADGDSDGLTDEEESGIYGTSSSSVNTDNDSFVDLNEVLNLFDPAKPTPATLREAAGIAVYANATQKYEILRPAAWTVREEGDDKNIAFINAASGEFVQITVSAKTGGTLLDWYLAQSEGASASQVVQYKTRQGFDALISPDQSIQYVDFGDKVVTLTYSLGARTQLQYKVTFQMMVQSLAKLP